MLNKCAAREAKKLAIIDLDQNGKSITWGQIAIQADRIAQLLFDKGVQPGDKVAVLSDENIEKLIVWMGICRYGAVICPINVEMNAAYIVEILDSIKPTITLCHKDFNKSILKLDNVLSTLTFG